MSENLRNFTKAVYLMDAVVHRVPADAWGNPSPCEGWSAADVVAHQTGVFDGVAHMAKGNERVFPQMPEDRSDPVGLWNASRDGVLDALDQPGALHHSDKYWFGPMTIDGLIGVVKWDPLTHSWDLSKAAGLEPVVDEGLAQISFDMITEMHPNLLKGQLIAEPVEVPADADIMSRFLGLVGRNPNQ